MASIASRLSSRSLRALARRAPRPATASFSLLARAPAAPRPAVQVKFHKHTPFFFLTSHKTVPARGVKTLNFAGSDEVVYERSDWPLAKLHDYFKNDTLALIGYGSQGHGQGLNARDNGLNLIVGVRKDGESWKQALEDGWVGPFLSRFPPLSPAFYRYQVKLSSPSKRLSIVEQSS